MLSFILPPVTVFSHIATLDINLRPLQKICLHDEGQALVEYATMLAVMLVLAVGLVRYFETNALLLLVQISKSIK